MTITRIEGNTPCSTRTTSTLGLPVYTTMTGLSVVVTFIPWSRRASASRSMSIGNGLSRVHSKILGTRVRGIVSEQRLATRVIHVLDVSILAYIPKTEFIQI